MKDTHLWSRELTNSHLVKMAAVPRLSITWGLEGSWDMRGCLREIHAFVFNGMFFPIEMREAPDTDREV